MNRTLIKIRVYLVGEQDEWDNNLGCIAGAYLSTPNESTRLTLNLLALGGEVRLLAVLIFGHKYPSTKGVPSYDKYVQGLKP